MSFVSVVSSLVPRIWHRLGESVGTTGAGSVVDVMGLANGTPTNATFGTAGAVAGDANTAATLTAGTIHTSVTTTAYPSSFVFFFKHASLPSNGNMLVVGNSPSNPNTNVGVYAQSANGIGIYMGVSGSYAFSAFTTAPPANVWHQYALVLVSSTDVRLFVDGVRVLNFSPARSPTGLTDINLGSWPNITDTVSGVYDDFMQYDYALTDAQVLSINNAAFGIVTNTPAAAGMAHGGF